MGCGRGFSWRKSFYVSEYLTRFPQPLRISPAHYSSSTKRFLRISCMPRDPASMECARNRFGGPCRTSTLVRGRFGFGRASPHQSWQYRCRRDLRDVFRSTEFVITWFGLNEPRAPNNIPSYWEDLLLPTLRGDTVGNTYEQ